MRSLERLPVAGRDAAISLSWHTRVDAAVLKAYEAVGGEAWVPRALLEQLHATESGHQKRIAVLRFHGAPWAVVPLSLCGRYWEPLLQGVIPELQPFPSVGSPTHVLAATGLAVGVWASPTDPSGWANVRWRERVPSYEFDLKDDPEPYWRKRDLWKSIVRANKRTADFELVVDDLQGAKWTIERWRARHFTGDLSAVSAKSPERLVATEWGLRSGIAHAWCLRDGDRWVAGMVGFVQNGRLAVNTVYRDPDYDWHSVGTRTFFETFRWAREHGLEHLSLGSQFDYKRRWAPASGVQFQFVVAPLPVYSLLATAENLPRVFRRVLNRVKR